jgi:hypothetical protein
VERDAFRLNNVQRLDVLPLLPVGIKLLDELGQIILQLEGRWDTLTARGFQSIFAGVGRSSSACREFAAPVAMRGKVDMDDLELVRVDNREEVHRMGVQVAVLLEAGVEKALLQSSVAEAIFVSDRPACAALNTCRRKRKRNSPSA